MTEDGLYEIAVEMVKRSCTTVSPDVMDLLARAFAKESSAAARDMLGTMIENVRLAGETSRPVCQSPGLPAIYVTFGDGADLWNIKSVFQRAVVDCTRQGYLRPSVVHPLTRKNPGDNSGTGIPNFEFDYEPGRRDVEIIISFKGCGAELGNVVRILTPATLGKDLVGLKRLVLETVIEAGGKPCPPFGLGIGIGGQMDVAARLSRKAISTREWTDSNPDPLLDDIERELLDGINRLGLGAAGVGGDTVALAVKIGLASTHTAICPVAVNFHCWVARRSGVRIHEDGSTEWIFKGADSRG